MADHRDEISELQLTRRQLLRAGVAVPLSAAFLAACGTSGASPTAAPATAAPATAAPATPAPATATPVPTENFAGQTIVVTSPSIQEGKTTTIVNLALTMAQNGQKTLLVGSNLRRPSIHRRPTIHRRRSPDHRTSRPDEVAVRRVDVIQPSPNPDQRRCALGVDAP